MTTDPSLVLIGDVLTLELDGHALKCKLPRGERGAPGRDGISIRGEAGLRGEPGAPGRDSTIPGERGPVGECGPVGRPGSTPELSIGTVVSGDTAAVILSGTVEKPVLNFILPKGAKGDVGRTGRDGKHGSHEYVSVYPAGNCPRYTADWLGCHVILDGNTELPEMTESDIGQWIHFKTFDRACVSGLVEEAFHLDKSSRKAIVIAYGGSYRFTGF